MSGEPKSALELEKGPEKAAFKVSACEISQLTKASPHEERRLVRKLDRTIIPLTCLLYLLAYLDRSNLGNARLQGLPEDALRGDPTGELFDWVNSAFFFSYIIFQLPSNLCSKLIRPRLFMAASAIGWGTVSTLMATAYNPAGLITARVFLGFFEACFGPAIPLYFTLFYTKTEMGLRMAFWFGFAAVAGAFGGLIAYGVQRAVIPFSTWRLLFIVEGIPTVLLGVVTFFLLPDRPESTSFLNERERAIAIERINRGTRADEGAVINKSHVYMALQDWRNYAGGVIFFCMNCSLASISAFLPTFIKSWGYSSATTQLLTVPPYAVAATVLTLLAAISDRLQSRGPIMAGASAVGGIGYALLLSVKENNHVKYFAAFCICAGTYTTIGTIIAWYAHNLGSETKKATGIPMFMAIGQCGSVLGSHLFPASQGPDYVKGFAVSCALQFLAVLCIAVLSISYRLENRARDRIHGKPIPDAPVDTSVLADKAPDFRYVP
ncbi:major facilitator superfamily domain-containing protein [Schizophyllum amplum]|uniref:Major facilitator superfamily domain-containing protein n=1 Tax=Schizophyllum amplum TaxID=97359 RepID=A0A550CBR0_9AGAR|nr:major facilitator superfamily domain-containing protein [Auriculariopsis ampla]